MRKIQTMFIAIGMFALSAQIILLKEFLRIFLGNELIIGIALFFWLIFSALGNLLVTYCKKLKIAQTVFNLNLLLISLSLPLLFFLIKIIYAKLTLSSGMTLDLSLIICACFFVFAPFTLLLGSLFTLGCSLKDITDQGIGRLYLFEGIGALIGGLLINMILIKFFSNFQIALIISWINLLFVFIFFKATKQKLFFNISAFILFVLLSPLVLNWNFLEKTYINSYNTNTGNTVLSSNSIYGNLTVTQNEDQYNFYQNGVLLGSSNDQDAKEEIAHYTYFAAKELETVLIIGGGFNGILHELLKHNLKKIIYLELDPQIITKTAPFLGKNDQQALQNQLVKVEYIDGRIFLKETKETFDLILVNLPGPLNGFLNRFYTDEFFKTIKGKLNKNGLFAFTFPPLTDYISSQMATLCGSVYQTVKANFLHVKLLPLTSTLFLASDNTKLSTIKAETMIEQLQSSHIQTSRLNPKLINYQLNQLRLEQLQETITKATKHIKKNYDFSPIAYFYNLLHWESAFSKFKILSTLFNLRSRAWIIPLIIMYLLCLPAKKASSKISRVTLSALTITGFGTISLELISIYLFQAIYGYAYYNMGMIFMFFMAGLTLGAHQAGKVLKLTISEIYTRVIIYQILLLIFSLMLPVAAKIILKFQAFNYLQTISFPLMNLYFGNLLGAEFCFISRLIFKLGKNSETSAAKTYSADLIGAAIGAALTSSLLIPLYGITQTCLLIAVLAFFSLIPLFNGIKLLKEV